MVWSGARPALVAKTTTSSPPVCACSVGGRPVLHGRCARGPRGTGFAIGGHVASKKQPLPWLGISSEEP